MTSDNYQTWVSYTGNASAHRFDFTFRALSQDEVGVEMRSQDGRIIQTPSHTISLNSGDSATGGYVDFTSPPSRGAQITIKHLKALKRSMQANAIGHGRVQAMENEFTNVFEHLAIHKAQLDTALQAPEIDSGELQALPPRQLRAERFMTFDSSGNPSVGNEAGSIDELKQKVTTLEELVIDNLGRDDFDGVLFRLGQLKALLEENLSAEDIQAINGKISQLEATLNRSPWSTDISSLRTNLQAELNQLETALLRAVGASSISNVAAIQAVPIGTIVFVCQSSVPSGFLEANGARLYKSSYRPLYNVIGTNYNNSGESSSSSRFRLPDLRGEFIRGWDHYRQIDSGRSLGSWQKASLMFRNRYQSAHLFYKHRLMNKVGTSLQDLDTFNSSYYTELAYSYTGSRTDYSPSETSTTVNNTFLGTTRPRNIALMACIKY